MKTILDLSARNALIPRINNLTEVHAAQWGKMNAFRMVKHCIRFEEMMLGHQKYKQAWIGRLFGRMALKGLLKDDGAIRRNMPTAKELIIMESSGDMRAAKEQWVSLLKEYAHFKNDDFIHPFFGKMTPEQIGIVAYKHTDHHLRQFNV